MRIFRDPDHISIQRPVATIGIFDGVHRAHRAVIEMLKTCAHEQKGESTIITLWPHPRYILNKDPESLRLLNTLEEKIDQLEQSGIQNLIIIPFTSKFASMEFEDFVSRILVEKIGIVHLVVGFNHHFGKDRSGNYEKLGQLSEKFEFGLSLQEPILLDQERVSSSVIRHYLEAGNLDKASRLLGYHYSLLGKVVGGYQKGRKIGFPTANLQLEDPHKLVPPKGVYAVIADIKGKEYGGMMNIGCRPTLHGDCEHNTIEVHLLDFEGDLYDEEIRIRMIERIRDEKKFESVELLRTQIEKDRDIIRKILGAVK